MAQMLLIMGESGTGKSTSMRNCDPTTTAVDNPDNKKLYEVLKSRWKHFESIINSKK